MAWPESLTASQQATVQAFVTDLRSWAASLSRLNVSGSALGAAWYATGGIATLIANLQSTDIIPNTSGYADAQDLAASDVTTLLGWAFTLSNPANSDQGTGAYASVGIQQLCVKAAGVNASIG